MSSREEGRAMGLARGASMRRVNVWDGMFASILVVCPRNRRARQDIWGKRLIRRCTRIERTTTPFSVPYYLLGTVTAQYRRPRRPIFADLPLRGIAALEPHNGNYPLVSSSLLRPTFPFSQ